MALQGFHFNYKIRGISMGNLPKIVIVVTLVISLFMFLFSCDTTKPRVIGMDESGAGIYQKQPGHVYSGASGCFN